MIFNYITLLLKIVNVTILINIFVICFRQSIASIVCYMFMIFMVVLRSVLLINTIRGICSSFHIAWVLVMFRILIYRDVLITHNNTISLLLSQLLTSHMSPMCAGFLHRKTHGKLQNLPNKF